jgi:ribosomal protein S18 acetylase RimI-like enzyme
MPAFPSSIEIRTLTPDDIYSILMIYRQCEDFLAFGPEPNASLKIVLKDLESAQNEGGIFQGIYTAGKMIGVVSYVPGGFEGELSNAFLSLLMIIPAFRGKGIGTKIVAMVEKEIFRDSHITAILSAVQVNNPDALRFWQKNGYRISGGPELRPDGTTVFRLRKDAKPALQDK